MTDQLRTSTGVSSRLARRRSLAEPALRDLIHVGYTPSVVACVLAAAQVVARSCGLSSPNGARPWSEDDVHDLVQDFLEHKGVGRPGGSGDALTQLAIASGVGADRADRFWGKLEKTMSRFVVDRYRETPRGQCIRSIDDRLRRRTDTVRVGSAWALADDASQAPWAGGDDALIAAASTIDAPILLRDDRPGRRSSICSTETLDALCDAVLRRAGCPSQRP